jgi:hypothetical protein
VADPGIVEIGRGNAVEAVADLLDRVVHRGAVVNGDVIISLAGIDLVRLDLRLLLLGIEGPTG